MCSTEKNNNLQEISTVINFITLNAVSKMKGEAENKGPGLKLINIPLPEWKSELVTGYKVKNKILNK